MKKILVLVLVFGFVAFAAFAQSTPSVMFNGDVHTGFQITALGSNTPQLSQYNLNAPGLGSRWDFKGTYNATTWGMAVQLRDNTNLGQGADIGARYAWGWLNLLNNMVTVKAGLLSDTTVKTGSGAGNQGFGAQDPNAGIGIDIAPISGLRLFYFLPTYFSAANNTGVVGTTPSGVVADSASDAFQGSFLGLAYYAEGIGNVQFGYQLATSANNNSAGTGVIGASTSSLAPYSYIDFGVAYTGMQNLTAYLEAKSTLASTSNTNFTYLGEDISYNMAPLSVTLWGEQQFGDSTVHGTFLNFQPHVDYTYGPADLGVQVDYGTLSLNGTSYTALGFGPYVAATVGGAVTTLGVNYNVGGTNYIGAPWTTGLGHKQFGPDMNANTITLADNSWQIYAMFDYSF